ncbi:unnamed protein product [Durusdinium trenchii]|uniref:Sulfotransferase domain-containing protein n=1 Tax=Durusdinium trenchii TaxID=1381693 RepID=A0ABP0MD61_9DINO
MFIHPTSSRDGGPQDGSRDHRTVQKTSCKKQLKDLFVITVPPYAIRIRTSEPSRSVPWRLHLSWQLRPLQRHVETLSDPQELQKRWQRRVEDLVVAVPPKSGTTMLLQVCHQLRVGGVWDASAFEDQMDVIPMLEGGPASLLPTNDINAEQVAVPRIYKSHLSFRRLPKSCKRIYCFRELKECSWVELHVFKDVLVSDWHFTASILESDVPLDAFLVMRLVPGGIDRALKDMCDWWEHRHDPGVLFFFFDDVLEDKAASVERVREFMGLESKPGLVHQVVEQSSHRFMCEHHSKFDDHKIVQELDRIRGVKREGGRDLKPSSGGGRSGSGEALPDTAIQWIEWRWRCIVQERLGFRDLGSDLFRSFCRPGQEGQEWQ